MSGDSTAGGESQRSNPTPFLTKTYQMVDDSNIDDLISWNENGSTFVVWKPAEFARDLLPKYFKHNNFSSFVRQLNTYGFRKIVSDRWEFVNDFFKRGEKSLLKEIQRRKIPNATIAAVTTTNMQAVAVALPKTTAIRISPASSGDEQVLSSNSSPAPPAMLKACSSLPDNLVEENDKLRKENSKLREELNRLKGLCGNVYNLMSGYAVSRGESSEGRASELMHEVVEGGGKTMDESEEEDEDELYPRLFGVSLGAKRLKRSEVGDLMQTNSLE